MGIHDGWLVQQVVQTLDSTFYVLGLSETVLLGYPCNILYLMTREH